MKKQDKINLLISKLEKMDNNNFDTIICTINHEIDKMEWSTSKKKKHKTVKVKHPDGEFRDIDKDISELISNLWELDIMTDNSCQNNYIDGYMWVEFSTYSDLMEFMDLIIRNVKPTEHERIIYPQKNESNRWFYKINFMDSTILNDEDDSIMSTETIYMLPPGFSVRFPKSDYKMILNIVKEKNKES